MFKYIFGRRHFFIGFYVFLFLLGCQTKNKSNTTNLALPLPANKSTLAADSAKKINPIGHRLQVDGENFRPYFLKNSNAVIFVSQKRSAHKNPQIYRCLLNSSNNCEKETRLTFSDGEADFPVTLQNDEKIAYISTTDAIKENPRLFSANSNLNIQLQDVFITNTFAFPVERLSKSALPITSISPVSEHQLILSVKIQKTTSDFISKILLINWPQASSQELLVAKNSEISFPIRNKNQVTIWSQKNSIWMQNQKGKSEVAVNLFSSIHDISWWDADHLSILVSGRMHNDLFDQIYILDLRLNCSILLAATNTDLWYPQTANKKLAYTAVVDGAQQIYIVNLLESLGACQSISNQQAPQIHSISN